MLFDESLREREKGRKRERGIELKFYERWIFHILGTEFHTSTVVVCVCVCVCVFIYVHFFF